MSYDECMNTLNNNERLKELVAASGLTQAEALERFNVGLGPAGYSLNSWKAFFSSPTTSRFRNFQAALLEHAEKVFSETHTV